MSKRDLAALPLVVLLAACGGHNPNGPSVVPTPAPRSDSFRVVAGPDNIQPIAGAKVTVDGVVAVSDASGNVSVTARPGAAVEIRETPDFYGRLTLLTDDRFTSGHAFNLWPKTLGSTFIKELCFSYDQTSGHLLRYASSTVYVEVSPDIWNDAEAKAAHVDAASSIATVTGGRVTYIVTNRAPVGASVIKAYVDPTVPAGSFALTRLDVQGSVIAGATLRYQRIVDARRISTVRHELGHTLGLNHTTARGLMNASSITGVDDFSPEEQTAVRMMYQRPAGSTWPDNDRN